MPKRNREQKLSASSVAPQTRAAPAGEPSPVRPGSRGIWAARFGTALFVPVLVLGLLEGALRLFGYGHPSTFLVPVSGTQSLAPNEKFLRRFYAETETTRAHPFLLPETKSANAFRVFIFGESAALGTPNPAFGFGRILEVLLRAQYPSRQIEVYNAAVRGINSHIVLPIVQECARHQPDLAIVYMGNNEVAGLHGPGPESTIIDRHLFFIRATHLFKGTRLGQFLMSGLRRTSAPKQDMEYFRAHRVAWDDPGRARVYDHFRANLQDILDALGAGGAQVLLATVPVNLKDFPPVASLPNPGLSSGQGGSWQAAYDRGNASAKAGQLKEALSHFQDALTTDAHPANLHFRLAQVHLALEQFDQAKAAYSLARDRDALQLRTDTRLNQIIRQAAAATSPKRLRLVDAEQAFSDSEWSDHGIPGQQLFSDHVHLRFLGDYLLARTFLSNITAVCGTTLGPPAPAPVPSIEQCAEALAYNEWEDAEVRAASLQQLDSPPFMDQLDHKERVARAKAELDARTRRIAAAGVDRLKASYDEVLAQRPDDWQVHLNYGAFLMLRGDTTNAVAHLRVPVRLFPDQASFRIRLADALAWSGQRREAIEQLREALRVEPASTVARKGLEVLARQ